MPSFRKRKAEPSALRVADNAEAIIAGRDAEIAELKATLAVRDALFAELQKTLSAVLALADGSEQKISAAITRLRPMSRLKGMTVAERAQSAARILDILGADDAEAQVTSVMLEALDVPPAAGEAVAADEPA